MLKHKDNHLFGYLLINYFIKVIFGNILIDLGIQTIVEIPFELDEYAQILYIKII